MLTRNIKLTIIGAIVGAVLGGTAAWAFAKMRDRAPLPEGRAGQQLALTTNPSEYVQLGVTLIALVRQVVDLFRLREVQTERHPQD